MTAYLETLAALAGELDSVARVLGSLRPDQWSSPTLLVPVGPVPRWTVLELAGHLGFAMNMIDTLLSGESTSAAVLDRVSFFDQPRERIAPLAYRTAKDVAASKSGAEILDLCATSFSVPVGKARLVHPGFVGSTVLGAMRIDEFIATRVVEVVVHGLDLAQALDRSFTPSREAVDCVADVLDSLGGRKGIDRPESLADGWLWVQVASGRRRHDDFPTPLLG
jgi:uncharacterized protein (TIGR03083 family)